MTTALAQRQDLLPDTGTWKTMIEMAGQLVESGMLPQGIKTPAAALAIMQKGRELGIPPMYALSNIGIINGRPVVGAEVLLAMVYRDHGDNAIVIEDTTSEGCTVTYRRRGWTQARRFAWTTDDAKKAGLHGKSGPWSQYPAAMLRARCISAVARLAFADSIGGMYTAEELGAEVDVTEDGEIVVVNQAPPVLRTVKAADVIQPEPSAPRASTPARPVQTQPEPAPSEEERARAMVGEVVSDRQAAEFKYAELSKQAVEKGHPKTETIKSADPKKWTDGSLAKAIKILETWLTEQDQPAQPEVDEAF